MKGNFYRIVSPRAWRLGREFVWIGVGKAAAALGVIVGVRLLTELMEPSVYGQLSLGMTVVMLMHQVVLGPLSNGATRFYAPACEARTLYSHLSAVRSLMPFLAAV